MAHPFEKLFELALKKSTREENYVLNEAEKLKEKGYPVDEIYTVLKKLRNSLIQDADVEIVTEATEEFSRHGSHAEE